MNNYSFCYNGHDCFFTGITITANVTDAIGQPQLVISKVKGTLRSYLEHQW